MLRATLTITVVYENEGKDQVRLAESVLEDAARYMADRGFLTRETPLEVSDYRVDVQVSEVPDPA